MLIAQPLLGFMFVQVLETVANLICIFYSTKATSKQREPFPK
jgi:hypothetical protein